MVRIAPKSIIKPTQAEVDAVRESHKPAKKEHRPTMEQEAAVELCCDLNERIVGVTGGAGVGKTEVLGRAFTECKRRYPDEKIILCAPTGRAAKRIQELTGIPALTIHRLLKFPTPDDPIDLTKKGRDKSEEVEIKNVPTDHEPRHHKGNPIVERIVFVDESSMLDPTLYHQLMNALPRGGCVRLFGDNNQLPPVEEGRPPFIDVIRNKPSITLTFNFRSEDDIVSNANLILKGSIPRNNDSFRVIYTHDPIRELIALTSEDYLKPEFQLIMPTRKGNFGTARVNTSIQLKLNKNGPFLRLDRFGEDQAPLLVRAHDKFLWIKNDYNLKLFNGEIGMIEGLDEEDGTMQLLTSEGYVHVPARVKTYSPYLATVINYDPRKQLELGYAITTHKSQGSEFDTIIYCMTSRAPFMLNRNNFYTGVTRAKSRVIVLCDRRAMGLALRRRIILD